MAAVEVSGEADLPLDLPLIVSNAVGAGRGHGVELHVAGACALLWAGARLYDDLTDGDLQPSWAAQPARSVIAGAFTLATVCAPALLAQAPMSGLLAFRVQRRYGEGLFETFEGQSLDLENTHSGAPVPAEVERSVAGKNGGPMALFCGLAAIGAGATDDEAARWSRWGRTLGVLYQLTSDQSELQRPGPAPDLRQGTRTLQVALWLEPLEGRARAQALDLLNRAATDPVAHEQVRSAIQAPRVKLAWTRTLARHIRLGRELLRELAPPQPEADALKRLLDARSLRCMPAAAAR